VAYLVDTSILVRLANRKDPTYPVADGAVVELHRRGELLHLTPQNLVEFRNVATRPVMVNGLGLAASTVEAMTADFESLFSLLPETPDIYPAWKTLVSHAGVIGKQVHDARLVAVCRVHKLSYLLTFNTAHFLPLARLQPNLDVLHPASVNSGGT
jgi:predicted nucleic acid-binding protein